MLDLAQTREKKTYNWRRKYDVSFWLNICAYRSESYNDADLSLLYPVVSEAKNSIKNTRNVFAKSDMQIA